MLNKTVQKQHVVKRYLEILGMLLLYVSVSNMVCAQEQKQASQDQQRKFATLVRLAEIEIHPQDLEAYKIILKETAKDAVQLEKGVIAIFPMFQQESPAQVRILEIYKDQAAYEAHLKTPHFLKYKTSTAAMVKSLKLVDMDALDIGTATLMFSKMNTLITKTTVAIANE